MSGGEEPLLEVDGSTSENGKGDVRSQLALRLDTWFEISARGSTIAAELRGGVSGFMTMSYILIVNPRILAVAASQYGIGLAPLMTATAASAAIMSLVVGVVANVPFGLMPGMGLNAYLVYSVCLALKITWQQALSSSFVAGAVLACLSVLGIADRLVQTVLPDHLKMSITVAIGVFQALIGFETMGLVVADSDTLVTIGSLAPKWSNLSLYVGLGGLLLITTLVIVAKANGAMLWGILCMAGISWAVGISPAPTSILSTPSWDAVLQIDFTGWVPGSPEFPGLVISSFVVLFVCLFDVAGVSHGLQNACGLEESPSRSSRIMALTGVGTMLGALLGTSPQIIAVESSSCIMEGARTGLASIVVSALFALSLSISPVLDAVPRVATAVPLIVVGAFMMAPCRSIEWDNIRVALPSFLTITLVPFTYSIDTGIFAGLLLELYLAGMGRACGKPIEDIDFFEENGGSSGIRTPLHATPQWRQEKRKSSSLSCSPGVSASSTPRASKTLQA